MGWDGRSRVSSTGPVAGVVRSGDRIEAQSDGRGRTAKRNQDVEDEQGKEEEEEHGLLIRLRRRIEGRRGCGVWSTLLTALGGQRVGPGQLCLRCVSFGPKRFPRQPNQPTTIIPSGLDLRHNAVQHSANQQSSCPSQAPTPKLDTDGIRSSEDPALA
ncbi:hypothetical protein CGGC5_v008183 [Colletotrichum fructicola Nara gc5]|uniref:Uncharacterized protein n=1 Tax=Colletotrichum fructicola (strain Nara gc5) TaxID=1213859 RepID=A0A7J6J1V7_COLFN|nr:hypothetical protein CGGC5_v008183 [Colletotrichum fructicola Nara gc5]KAF5499982.1 hypothetical protein CGCF413_v007440 [Colletotrichum fructicola]